MGPYSKNLCGPIFFVHHLFSIIEYFTVVKEMKRDFTLNSTTVVEESCNLEKALQMLNVGSSSKIYLIFGIVS